MRVQSVYRQRQRQLLQDYDFVIIKVAHISQFNSGEDIQIKMGNRRIGADAQR
jgi:hypothetical protein